MNAASATLVLALTAASAHAQQGTSSAPRILRPSIELVIDARRSADDLLIGRTAGYAMDSTGRIHVADALDENVRVYSPTGTLLYRLGREASRPFSMVRPCCLMIRVDTLLIREQGTPHYSVYVIGNDRAAFIHQVDASRIDVATAVVPPPPVDTLASYRVTLPGKYSDVGIPGRPTQLRAFNRQGDAAYAMSATYAVQWIDAKGNPIVLIEQPHKRLEYSAQERAMLESEIANRAANAGVPRDSIKRDPPTEKPPLRALQFDLDGRLWVFRNVEQGRLPEADVYDRSGTLWAVVQWPPTLIMSSAAFSGTLGLALSRDTAGAERVVRVRLR